MMEQKRGWMMDMAKNAVPRIARAPSVNANLKMSIFAETKCNFSPVSTEVYTALIHQFTCRFEARQALIYQLVLGLTGENGKYNYSRAVHVYPLFFDITCSAKNYKIAPALTPRAWIYCRMAHSGPDSAGLLAMQRRQLEACAKEHGFEIVGYSSDVGSGLTFNRPGLLDFLDAVDDEAADVLLLSDLTRLGRDMGRAAQFWQLLRGRGIGIYTAVNGEIDLSMKVMLQKVIGQ